MHDHAAWARHQITTRYGTPPIVAPVAIASWMTATISPPPASLSSGSTLLSQVHQPTGAAVPMSPQPKSSAPVANGTPPSTVSASAIAAIASGIAISTLYSCVRSAIPISHVPISPAPPVMSRTSDSAGMSRPVTVSRNGRRYVKSANCPRNRSAMESMPVRTRDRRSTRNTEPVA